MTSVSCEHNLTHKFERHECDGCCVQYVLTEEPKGETDE